MRPEHVCQAVRCLRPGWNQQSILILLSPHLFVCFLSFTPRPQPHNKACIGTLRNRQVMERGICNPHGGWATGKTILSYRSFHRHLAFSLLLPETENKSDNQGFLLPAGEGSLLLAGLGGAVPPGGDSCNSLFAVKYWLAMHQRNYSITMTGSHRRIVHVCKGRAEQGCGEE